MPPFFLCSATAGRIADELDKSRLIRLIEPLHWRILADLFGIAASGGVFVVPLYALLQAMTEREHRARAIAANNIVNAAAMVISSVVTMALIASGVSIPGLFLLAGSATVAVAVLFWRMLPLLPVPHST